MAMARSRTYSDDAFDWIIEQIANGESLINLVNQPGCPTNGQFQYWLSLSRKRQAAYATAKVARAEWLIARNDLLAADRTRDFVQPNAVRRDELQIKHNQWLAERFNRPAYGQHVQQELSGNTGTTLVIGDTKAAAEIARRRREGKS